jgi:hypothetical protein
MQADAARASSKLLYSGTSPIFEQDISQIFPQQFLWTYFSLFPHFIGGIGAPGPGIQPGPLGGPACAKASAK